MKNSMYLPSPSVVSDSGIRTHGLDFGVLKMLLLLVLLLMLRLLKMLRLDEVVVVLQLSLGLLFMLLVQVDPLFKEVSQQFKEE